MLIQTEQEIDGRWIAEAPAIPGALAYGASREEAVAAVRSLVAGVLAERSALGEPLELEESR